MELYQLKYFQTVARLGHMTKAAQVLQISQPSLSRAIAQLEQEIGAPLFDRVGRGIRLNQYGEVLLRRVDFMLGDLERVQREIADLLGPEQGVVTLSVPQSSASVLLPRALGAFRQLHPGIRLQISNYREEQAAAVGVFNCLNAGTVNLCLCTPPDESVHVSWKPVVKDTLYLAVPLAHPLAGRASIHLGELAAEQFICLPTGTSFRYLINSMCKQAGFTPDIVVEVED